MKKAASLPMRPCLSDSFSSHTASRVRGFRLTNNRDSSDRQNGSAAVRRVEAGRIRDLRDASMTINAVLPEKGRDLRLDLFRGIANWAIFLDHIPDNVVNWVTTRNYGFSDAADLFVFISGYTASFVYARMMIERGFIVGATRLFKRVWQLYVAHIILFVIYIVAISFLAQRFADSELINEFNVAGLVDHATQTLGQDRKS